MSQYLALGRCGQCSTLFRPNDCELSTEMHGSYRVKGRVKKEDEVFAKLGMSVRNRDARLVDETFRQVPSLSSGRDFLRDVTRKSWVSAAIERDVRIGAFIQMNHHRRPLKVPTEWTGWPLPDELSSFDWEVIEQLGGRRTTWLGLASRLADRQEDAVPTRPKCFERRTAFGDDESIPRGWASEQAKMMIEEAKSGNWPADGLQTNMSSLEEQNIKALIELLGTTNNERVMRAECFRSLGDFDACLAEIRSLRDCDLDLGIIANAIEGRALSADRYVALVEGRKFVRQSVSDQATVTFSIPRPGFGYIPDI